MAAAATPTGNGYWFTDSVGLVSNFGSADYYGSAPSPLFRPIVGMAEAPGTTGAFVGSTYPSGSYGYDISTFQCNSLPGGDHQIGIVQVDGSSSGNTNPCLAAELAWAGNGLNLYTYLTYGTSSTPEPGCGGDTSCNAGYQAGIYAYNDAFNAGAGAAATPWWLDVETASANWSGNLSENAEFVQGALSALHETEGISDVGIYASPGVWNSIVGNYQPNVPYWMADYLASPSGPGSCADYQNWVTNHGAQLPGPPQIVQYNSAQYDEDYACSRDPWGRRSGRGDLRYTWRAPFRNPDVNALHAEGFAHVVLDADWRSRVEHHSLGWVCAFEAARLIGFVNVAWDGGVHAFVVDTLVARSRRRAGVGCGLLEVVERECRAAGCEWLHVDFAEDLREFYLGACGFAPTPAGLIALR